MTVHALDGHGRLVEPTTLEIQRLLPGPIERVWAYLTDDALRRQWEQKQQEEAGEAIVEKGQQETPKNRNPLGLRVISKGLRREDR